MNHKYHVWPDSKSGRWIVSRTVLGTNNEMVLAECYTQEEADLICAAVKNHANARGLAIMCNAYLEPIADQLALCHDSPHEASMLRQLLTDARAIIDNLKP